MSNYIGGIIYEEPRLRSWEEVDKEGVNNPDNWIIGVLGLAY